MSADPQPAPSSNPMTGSQAVVEALLRCGISSGFGIPSIHNIALYDGLRQAPGFHHWVVRHEQAAGFAADGFYRRSGRVAAVFASTGPGNLFTLVPLLESLQTNTPVLVIGSNIASTLLTRTGGALHETPHQIDVFKPLTRFARRVTSADELPETIAAAAEMLHGPAPGPAFVEISHDFFHAPVANALPQTKQQSARPAPPSASDLAGAERLIARCKTPAIIVGSGIRAHTAEIREFAEKLQVPVLTTTSGKGLIADDHALALGCISRLGVVQEVLDESDLLITIGAKLTEFDTGRFTLRLPAEHVQVVEEANYGGDRFTPSVRLVGDIGAVVRALRDEIQNRSRWCDIAAIKAREQSRLEGLKADAYSAIRLLRNALDRDDVVVNDQSILNYWASAFFPVLAPGTFLYPSGSGTLGYGLPAAIGAACAMRLSGEHHRIVCIAGDGGFQYTLHELATLAQYGLPVKILLVNDNAYGIIGFLQRSMFGVTHEVALKNPDFCRVAEAYGVRADRATSFGELQQKLRGWLDSPGPALLEWGTELKAPWEVGAIHRPTNLPMVQQKQT
jgi:thiamine pyrophosphate-dependent acetolactate synthase large subunit-like protein